MTRMLMSNTCEAICRKVHNPFYSNLNASDLFSFIKPVKLNPQLKCYPHIQQFVWLQNKQDLAPNKFQYLDWLLLEHQKPV